MVQVSVRDLAALLGGDCVGDPSLPIRRLGTLENAGPDTVSFLANPRYQSQLSASLAGCVLLSRSNASLAQGRPAAIICDDAYLAFAQLTQWWATQTRTAPAPGIHPTAHVAASAQVDPTAHVGPFAFVDDGAVVRARAVVGPHCVVGARSQVGEDTVLHARVTLYAGCRIGQQGIVHAGVVIGADGFGFAPQGGQWVKIEQLAGVNIGDRVEIGANTCIDRGALEDTVIEDGVKLDNLVQIGHNVHVGAHTAMAGCVGVAGSARIGRHCTVGGGAIVLGHLELVDHVHISAATVVSRSILKPGQYTGVFPFDDNAAWEKNAATLRQLHAMRDRLRALEKASK
jgi:UDP-3-O-[3-hydroxymyristoyl] glucosamine N-acyltransferase